MAQYPHDDTPTRRAKHQPECELCGKPATVLFKDVWNDSSTWVFLSCDEEGCGHAVCRACCDEDEEGHVTCTSCIESALHRNKA